MDLLEAALELAKKFLEADECDRAHEMFLQVESNGAGKSENDEKYIRTLIEMGMQMQDLGRWTVARPFFEHALASSIGLYGLENNRTTNLERTLVIEEYDPHPFDNANLRQRLQNRSRGRGKRIVNVYFR